MSSSLSRSCLFSALCLLPCLCYHIANAQTGSLFLIAHRGGVVDSSFTENGMPALKRAVMSGYQMVETDVRVSKDGILVANHDADFRRYYGVDKKVSEMDWAQIEHLKSKLDGSIPLKLEQVFQFCQQHHMGIMLDNKIAGMDSVLFAKLIVLLEKYDLRNSALMIGTDESTEYFTGKVRLSCSRKQLEENKLKPTYNADHFFFFEAGNKLSQDDVAWARAQGIFTVAAINKFHYRKSQDMMNDAEKDCKRLQQMGLKNFQIDSEFRNLLNKR